LIQKGIKVTVITLKAEEELPPDCAKNLKILKKFFNTYFFRFINIYPANFLDKLNNCDLLIDALLGTGFRGNVKTSIKDIINRINDSKKPVLSIDIPSGLNGNTGKPGKTAVKAKITVAIGCLKKGFLKPSAKQYTGKIIVADIGLIDYGK